MSYNRAETPLNPTAEEVQDEAETNATQSGTESRIPWSPICTQHTTVLTSHLQMLQSLKSETSISSDAEASKLISNMFERTLKLVSQFEGIKKVIIPRATRSSTSTSSGPTQAQTDSNNPQPAGSQSSEPNPRSEDGTSSKRRKRARISNESQNEPSPQPQPQSQPEPSTTQPAQRSKRKRLDLVIPGSNEDVSSVMPVSLDTEDISDEVQRRLKIKEEKRKRRDGGGKPEKRKRERDSLASNGSASTSSMGGSGMGAGMKPRKRVKVAERSWG